MTPSQISLSNQTMRSLMKMTIQFCATDQLHTKMKELEQVQKLITSKFEISKKHQCTRKGIIWRKTCLRRSRSTFISCELWRGSTALSGRISKHTSKIPKNRKTFTISFRSKSLIKENECQIIFFRIPDLTRNQNEIVKKLTLKLRDWSTDSTFTDIIWLIKENLKLYEEYINNYTRARMLLDHLIKTKQGDRLADLLKVSITETREKDIMVRPKRKKQTIN